MTDTFGDRHMEGHASELVIQFWESLAHSHGSIRGYRDDVPGIMAFTFPLGAGHP